MQNSNNRSRSSSDHYFHKLDMLMTKPLASAKLPGKDKKKHITYRSITYFLFVLGFFFGPFLMLVQIFESYPDSAKTWKLLLLDLNAAIKDTLGR